MDRLETWSELKSRIATLAIAIPALVIGLMFLPPSGFGILIGITIVLSSWEYTSITLGAGHRSVQIMSSLGALAVGIAIYVTGTKPTGPNNEVVIATLAGVVIVLFVANLFVRQDVKSASLRLGSSLVSLLYCGVLPAHLALLRRDAGVLWIGLALIITWGSDIAAYLVGKSIGKHKLAPQISPNKTVEGAIAGFVAALVGVLILKLMLMKTLSLGHVLLLVAPANVLAQLGDLCESLIKRSGGVKDSSGIIPGHGGVLDIMDGLCFAAPWLYYFHRYLT
ncbi:phosphatidate cytidylyltransferase [candidate division KSB1 bacterium]|nr:phosphatidate cytidylyltransferase [candidate division KSB1 bacterium]